MISPKFLGTSLVCWYHTRSGDMQINHTLLFPGEDDLVDVVEEVMVLSPKWRSLGLVLRLKATELNTISSKNHNDSTECLKDMLLVWLQQCYKINMFGIPSWRMLCQAISNPAGGNNPPLARKIAERHQGTKCTLSKLLHYMYCQVSLRSKTSTLEVREGVCWKSGCVM